MRKKSTRILVALVLYIIIFTIDKIVNLGSLFTGVIGILFPFGLYFVVYLLVGYDIIWKACSNVFRGQILDENFLMVIATFGAFGLVIYRGVNGLTLEGLDEACAVLLFYQVGEYLQKHATNKSRKSISHLMELRPDYANLLVNGEIKKVDPSKVNIGAEIVINPGERIPLDGIVIKGESNLDTKNLTGESLPCAVKVNDEVLSGCVNLTTQIIVKVSKAFYDSTATKILDLVESASMKKSKAENFITKFARYYTPIVIFLAVFLAICSGLILKNWGESIYRALNFLIVSCPCALIISVPLSFFIAMGAASKQGILIKGSNYLEKLNKSKIFVFDKTGTLTKGNFVITAIEPNANREEILAMAAIAEKDSNHPIARTILSAYSNRIQEGFTLTNIAGEGVIANNGKDTIYCGSAQLMQNHKIDFVPQNNIGSHVYVARNQTYLGCIVIQDEIKSEAKEVLQCLSEQSMQNVMLTGDNDNVAAQVASNLGIITYRANLLPQDKLTALEQIFDKKRSTEALCFIGDGINDAPVLARADVGISMGGLGCDAALEAADIILMHDNLRGLVTAKRLARRTMKIVHQNIFISILIKMGILALSAFGIASIWMAIFGDIGVTLLAILNSFRVGNKTIDNKKRVNSQ